jgi:GTP-binding protein
MAPTPDSWRPVNVRFVGSFPKSPPMLNLPEIAFAGRSNVGKSSAINAILGRKAAARVSKTPGRTQAVNLFVVDEELVVADLPGYGFARVPAAVQEAWKETIEMYLVGRRDLRLVVLLVDSRHPAQKRDLDLLAALRKAKVPYMVVATKTDKLSRNKRRGMLTKLAAGLGEGERGLLPLQSLKRIGTGAVWDRLRIACATERRF